MIITIARQTGCGALHVGERLASYYGVPFYTRQSLRDMAEKKGLLSEMDDFFEERPADELMFAISTDYADITGRKHEKTLDLLADMIGEDDCIIIGRCGNYIFRKRTDLVSVFLKGDIERRVANIAAEEHLSAAQARLFVQEQDDHRRTYHRYHTGLTWGNAEDYDLCLDSCRLTVDATARMIETYVGSTLPVTPHTK
jgi:cytidylate kinase